MARSGIRGEQIKDDSLTGDDIDESTLILDQIRDADGDTKVQVEESADEDKIRFDVAGAEKMVLDATGLGIGTASPATTLHAYADASNAYVATIDNDAGSSAHGLKVTSDGTGTGTTILDIEAGSTTVFKVRGDGRVGIGVATPGSTLSVDDEIAVGEKLIHRGDPDTYLQFPSNDNITFAAGGSEELKIASDAILVKQYIKHDGDEDTFMRFEDDTITLEAGGRAFIKLEEDLQDKVVINPGVLNIDLKVGGANQANLIRTDAANDRVGFGTMSPAALLHLSSSDDGAIFKVETAFHQTPLFVTGSNRVGIGTTVPTELLTLNGEDDNASPYLSFTEGDADRAKIGINDSNNLVIQQLFPNKHIVMKVNDAGVTREGFRLNGSVPEVVVNESSDSLVDFRVESNNNTHMLYVDGGNNAIGINDATPTSTLTIMGSLALNVHSINAANDPGTTYSVSTTDCVLLINTRPTAEGGIDSAITLTLPDASDNPGMVLTIKDAAGYCDVNAITINASAGDSLDGNPSTTSMNLPSPASWKKLISDGVNSWYEIGS